jgi:hypothetical protein
MEQLCINLLFEVRGLKLFILPLERSLTSIVVSYFKTAEPPVIESRISDYILQGKIKIN